jgi:hypothetical protein
MRYHGGGVPHVGDAMVQCVLLRERETARARE